MPLTFTFANVKVPTTVDRSHCREMLRLPSDSNFQLKADIACPVIDGARLVAPSNHNRSITIDEAGKIGPLAVGDHWCYPFIVEVLVSSSGPGRARARPAVCVELSRLHLRRPDVPVVAPAAHVDHTTIGPVDDRVPARCAPILERLLYALLRQRQRSRRSSPLNVVPDKTTDPSPFVRNATVALLLGKKIWRANTLLDQSIGDGSDGQPTRPQIEDLRAVDREGRRSPHTHHPNFSAHIGPMPRCFHSLRSVALQTQQVPVVWP